MGRNPWACTPEQAAAREDAIYEQFLAEIKRADQRFADPRQKDLYLDKQYGSPPVKAAIMASLMRRSAAR